MTERFATGVYRPCKLWSAEALSEGLKRFCGRKDARWGCPKQEQALTAVMSQAEQVVAILPTGVGKKPLFMLPCTLPDAGATVLVASLVALERNCPSRQEMRRSTMSSGNVIEWLKLGRT
jgi:superfamily II DNA helicase RecQ